MVFGKIYNNNFDCNQEQYMEFALYSKRSISTFYKLCFIPTERQCSYISVCNKNENSFTIFTQMHSTPILEITSHYKFASSAAIKSYMHLMFTWTSLITTNTRMLIMFTPEIHNCSKETSQYTFIMKWQHCLQYLRVDKTYLGNSRDKLQARKVNNTEPNLDTSN